MLEATVLDLQNATRVASEALENGNWKKNLLYCTYVAEILDNG